MTKVDSPTVQIKLMETATDLEQVRSLFKEYFDWVDRVMRFDMTYQGLATELEALPGDYAQPGGCLLLAEVDGQAAGCVALRPRQPGICELKRMYVRPIFQGCGLGQALCERVIQEGKRRGYSLMRLDTEKSLSVAQHIYHSFGFQDVLPYYDAPPEIGDRAVFMELVL
jgi:putative acetyltransferase